MIFTDPSIPQDFVGDYTTWSVQAFAEWRVNGDALNIPSGVPDAVGRLVRPSTWVLSLPTAGGYYICVQDARGAVDWRFVAADITGQ